MSTRHSGLVVASGKTKSSSKKSGAKRKLRHMTIRPVADGGFVTEKHFEPEEGKEFDNPPVEKAHQSADDMLDHVDQTFNPDEEENASGNAPASGGDSEGE